MTNHVRRGSRRIFVIAAALALGSLACAPAPAETVKVAEVQAVPVAMYMTEWCPVCRHARDWLENGGYDFVEHDVERDPRAAVFFVAVNPRGSVPTFDVGGQIVVGFDPDQLRAAIAATARETNRTAMAPPPSTPRVLGDGGRH
jgi:glutaredoxin